MQQAGKARRSVREGRTNRSVFTRFSRSRPAFVVTLLVALLGLTGFLTLQAVDAARSHRATAERVLADYTGLAAREFVRRTLSQLGYYGFGAALRYLPQKPQEEVPLPEPDQVTWRYGADRMRGLVLTYFRIDLDQGNIETSGQHSATFFDKEVMTSLRDAASNYRDDWGYSLIELSGGRPEAIVYQTTRSENTGPRVQGFVTRSDSFQPFFDGVLEAGPLLPLSLEGQGVDNSLLSISVSSLSGSVIFRTKRAYYAEISVYEDFPQGLSGLQVSVTLKPEAASQLIIGGLPRARVPLLVGLLVLNTGLILAAILLLRRERDLARRQSDFIGAVSHELRTPLSQIQLFSETLRLKRLRSEGEQSRSIEIICQETQRLANLVENVIQFSRSERRGTRLRREPVNLDELLCNVIEAYGPLAESGDAKLEFVSSAGGGQLLLDSEALRRILINLLDNAVKYGPKGQTITVSLLGRAGSVQIVVEDQGAGIEEAERERIWGRFERLPRHRDAAVAGAGIGLWVVRDLTLALGGRVWVERGDGDGARFVVEFQVPDQIESPSDVKTPQHETEPGQPSEAST